MSSERESVSDRLAILYFYLVSALMGVSTATIATTLIVQLFVPVRNPIPSELLLFALSNHIAYLLNPPNSQRKKEPEQQAIAEKGGLVQQVQAPDNDG